MDAQDRAGNEAESSPDYENLLELENLESLLEELEEGGWDADIKSAQLPGDLQRRVDEAQVRDVTDLRHKIAHLHTTLDKDEDTH